MLLLVTLMIITFNPDPDPRYKFGYRIIVILEHNTLPWHLGWCLLQSILQTNFSIIIFNLDKENKTINTIVIIN